MLILPPVPSIKKSISNLSKEEKFKFSLNIKLIPFSLQKTINIASRNFIGRPIKFFLKNLFKIKLISSSNIAVKLKISKCVNQFLSKTFLFPIELILLSKIIIFTLSFKWNLRILAKNKLVIPPPKKTKFV